MLTAKIESQDFAARLLGGHIRSSRVSHTYLFSGEAGSGKEDLAFSFACALNCLSNHYFQDCDCISCRKAAGKNHPDIHILGQDQEERSIKIEEIRQTISAAGLKPYEGKWKVFVVLGAERITAEASNALLKTLEEAPAHTVFILVTDSRASLLETIQSRAFHVRLKPLEVQSPLPLGFSQEIRAAVWEDYFDQGAAEGREGLIQAIDHLLFYFRERLEAAPEPLLVNLLGAIEMLIESKEAVDGNSNLKLTASRMAMHLRRLLPKGSL